MFENSNFELWQGDCLELMKDIPDKSVDMIFTDLPYSTTQNSWDCMINLDELWKQYKRIIKKNGCIALWAQAPFSHVLALSNLSQYRYEWIIEKTKATGHLNAKKMPMKAHENVMVFADLDESPETLQIFYDKLPTYNPQMTEGHTPVHSYTKHTTDGSCYGETKIGIFSKRRFLTLGIFRTYATLKSQILSLSRHYINDSFSSFHAEFWRRICHNFYFLYIFRSKLKIFNN